MSRYLTIHIQSLNTTKCAVLFIYSQFTEIYSGWVLVELPATN
ncbi:hypothetical protein VCR29J2_430288 [Vibrio coralliirubri]|nr:hypothetical protein VCR29J2_430288 [Vibrio coralliirubri]